MTHSILRQVIAQKNSKQLLLIVTAFLFCAATSAQQKPAANNKRPPASTYGVLQDTSKVMDIREKLVQLALQNPNYEVADRRIAIAHYQLKKAKGSWLGVVQAAGNFNEFSFNQAATNGANLYPRYNLGIGIPFDVFTNKGNEIKIARQNVAIAQAEKNERFREIKAEVLTKYEDYVMWKLKLELESQVIQDTYVVYLQAEKDFSDGIIKQEDYNKAVRAHADEKSKMAEIQHNYNVTKIDLEKMIGIPIEEVLPNK